MSGAFALLRRELSLAFRAGGGAGLGVAFFVIAASLVPFGVGPAPETLSRIAPGIVWVMALLACLLTLERMFQADVEDGTMDVLATSPLQLEMIVIVKCAAHWLTSGLPLVIASPVIALTYAMPSEAYLILIAALAIGTPALSLIGAIGAALTAGLKRGGLLTAIIVMPLYIPTLIFGALAVNAAAEGFPAQPYLLLLGAVSLACLPLCPIVSAAALRLAIR